MEIATQVRKNGKRKSDKENKHIQYYGFKNKDRLPVQ